MPWCPKCRTEYRDGVTECADCKTALVDRLDDELIPFFQAEDKRVADRLSDFFEYSGLKSAVFRDEENDCYIVAIDPKKQMEAKKLYQAFYFVERERMLKGESDIFTKLEDEQAQEADEPASDDEKPDETATGSSSDDEKPDEAVKENSSADEESPFVIIEEEDDLEKSEDYEADEAKDSKNSLAKGGRTSSEASSEEDDSTEYVMKADRYKDLTGTVWMFLIFGLGGLVFVLLNILGILKILTGWLPNTIMAALFIFFLYVSLSTAIRAKKLKAEIAAEEELTKKINDWLAGNVTKDFLKKISDENASSEVNYLEQVAAIKEMLEKEFGKQNPAYIDRLIEEYYNKTFGETDR